MLIVALNQAKEWGIITQNVAQKTKVPKPTKRKPKKVTDAQLDTVLDAVANTRLNIPTRVALGTGMRIGETLGLLWDNVRYDDGELDITGSIKYLQGDDNKWFVVRKSTKDHEERTIPLAASVAQALREQWKLQVELRRKAGANWHEQGLVFTDRVGNPLNPARISEQFTNITKRCKLVRFTFHSLRHGCVSFLIRQGEHSRVIADLLGHSSTRTTDLYGDAGGATRGAIDRLDLHINRKRGS